MSKRFSEAALAILFNPRLLNPLRVILTLLTVAVIAWYVKSRPPMDFSGMALRWDRLALACACLPAMLLIRFAKWRIILKAPSGGKATYREATASYLGSMALGLVTPGRVGEMSRGLYLPHPEVNGWRGAGLTVLDSWTDLVSVLAWGVLGGWLLYGAAGAAGAAALLAVGAPIPLWLALGAKVTRRFPAGSRLRGLLGARHASSRRGARGGPCAGPRPRHPGLRPGMGADGAAHRVLLYPRVPGSGNWPGLCQFSPSPIPSR